MASLSSEFSACEAIVSSGPLVVKSIRAGSCMSTMFLLKMLRAALRSMGLPAALREDCGYIGRSAVKLRRWVSWSRAEHSSSVVTVRWAFPGTPRRTWMSWSGLVRKPDVGVLVRLVRGPGGRWLGPWVSCSAWSVLEVGVLVRLGPLEWFDQRLIGLVGQLHTEWRSIGSPLV